MTPDERDRLVRLEANQDNLEKAVKEVAIDVKAIREQSNRWKGALGVILGLGGIIGFLAGWLKDWISP